MHEELLEREQQRLAGDEPLGIEVAPLVPRRSALWPVRRRSALTMPTGEAPGGTT
jgi:hypothetical protein